MYLYLKTYMSKPKDIIIEDYCTKDYMINTQFYIAEQLINGGAFKIIINNILKDREYHRMQVFIKNDSDLIKEINDEIDFYSNITPNTFLDLLKHDKLNKEYINKTLNSLSFYIPTPIYDSDNEIIIHKITSNSIIENVFSTLLNHKLKVISSLNPSSSPYVLTPDIMHQLKPELETQIKQYPHKNTTLYQANKFLNEIVPYLNLDTYYLLECSLYHA